jgi:hypothetical protein
MSSVKTLRRTRKFQVGAIGLNVCTLTFNLLLGHYIVALIPVACIAVLSVAVRVQTGTIRRREYADRPRPDYASIAAMERDLYGETFEHEGAPRKSALDPDVAKLHAMMDDLAERATAKRRRSRALDIEDDRRAMRAPAAASRPAPRWDGRTTHPDTTEPATVDQYIAWLKGYIKRGGKPTHFYDYPFDGEDFRYASSRVVVDSDYEYGSSSRHIIVARNVTTERTNPAGFFDGWAHTKLFFMHGYRTNSYVVPVYSDPEFDFTRSTP